MKEVEGMKLWQSIVLFTLAIALTYYLTTRTDEYQIGKIVMNHARKFAKENGTSLAGCKIRLLKDGVAILFGEDFQEDRTKTKYIAGRQYPV